MPPRRRQKIWITRAQPGAESTAKALRAQGHDPFVAPLLEVRRAGEGAIDLTGVGALAFTSANAARAFAERTPAPDLPAFAVGQATAEALRAAGFARVIASDGGVAELAGMILARRGEFAGDVLQPGARELAGDLVGALQAGGVAARTMVLYETRPRRLTAQERAEIPRLDAALAHSAKAAGLLAEVLTQHPAPTLSVYALSQAALAPLAATPLKARRCAARPNEAALLELIGAAA